MDALFEAAIGAAAVPAPAPVVAAVAPAAVPVMAAVAPAAVPVMAAVAAAQTIGCKLDVWKGTAMRTKGGLMRQHLRLNRVGSVVSIKASEAAKRNKNLGNFQVQALTESVRINSKTNFEKSLF
jgi:hypothetical protein